MPLIRPFATDGAAPMTTTNRIALSLIWKSRMASGNHMIDGIVCRPVISEPTAARSGANRETAAPTTVPISAARAKPVSARVRVSRTPSQKSPVVITSFRSLTTVCGPGSTYSGFQPDQTTICHSNSTITTASSFGQVFRQIRLPIEPLSPLGASSRASSPDTSLSCTVAAVPAPSVRPSSPARADGYLVGMTGHLRAEPVGDLGGLAGHLGGVDAPGPAVGDREVLDHPAGPAAQQHDPVAEPDRLAHVVGHEQDGELLLPPDPLELVVQEVPGHRVERAERLVHQQNVRVLRQRAGERHALARTAGELVRPLAAEAAQPDDLQ